MTKQDLIDIIVQARIDTGVPEEDAKISVYGYNKKTRKELEGLIRDEAIRVIKRVRPGMTDTEAEVIFQAREIDDLKRRLNLLEGFITAGWSDADADAESNLYMLEDTTLIETIHYVVENDFHVSAETTVVLNRDPD